MAVRALFTQLELVLMSKIAEFSKGISISLSVIGFWSVSYISYCRLNYYVWQFPCSVTLLGYPAGKTDITQIALTHEFHNRFLKLLAKRKQPKILMVPYLHY